MRSRVLSNMVVVFLVVLAADLLGLVTAVATGLTGAAEAVLSGSPLNAPVPFIAVQAAAVTAAAYRRGRPVGTVAAAILMVLCAVSVFSGLADGSYGNDELSAAELAIQVAIVAPTTLLAGLAARQVIRSARARDRQVPATR